MINQPYSQDGPPYLTLYAACVRCGAMTQGDPDTIPSVWVHTGTRCPVGPDGQSVRPGQPDVVREAVCPGCVALIRSGAPVSWPLARLSRIRPPANTVITTEEDPSPE